MWKIKPVKALDQSGFAKFKRMLAVRDIHDNPHGITTNMLSRNFTPESIHMMMTAMLARAIEQINELEGRVEGGSNG
ncbi:MAG: hypothetical protein IJS96_03330 [Schwartzia sp.]|nr:hypothetical protein [Schwartzia sp. (in: firmicutes)]